MSAEFLGLADERAVELLLPGKDARADDAPVGTHDAPPPEPDRQRRVIDAITRQLDIGGRPTRELTQLFLELMAWAKVPANAMPGVDSDDPVAGRGDRGAD